MQLSVSSGKYGILQRATFLTFGDSLDHTNDYPLEDMVAAANAWVQKVGFRIWKANAMWQFDDRNYTTLPFATTALDATKQDYSLPATAIGLEAVYVKDVNGKWHRLKQKDQAEQDLDFTSQDNSAGLPQQYDLVGSSIILDRLPTSAACTLAAGLKVVLSREMNTFSVPASYATADTTEPGFEEDFHHIIPMGIKHDYLEGNDTGEATNMLSKIELEMQKIDEAAFVKNKDKKPGIRPASANESFE